jgi:hypothetical protein
MAGAGVLGGGGTGDDAGIGVGIRALSVCCTSSALSASRASDGVGCGGNGGGFDGIWSSREGFSSVNEYRDEGRGEEEGGREGRGTARGGSGGGPGARTRVGCHGVVGGSLSNVLSPMGRWSPHRLNCRARARPGIARHPCFGTRAHPYFLEVIALSILLQPKV